MEVREPVIVVGLVTAIVGVFLMFYLPSVYLKLIGFVILLIGGAILWAGVQVPEQMPYYDESTSSGDDESSEDEATLSRSEIESEIAKCQKDKEELASLVARGKMTEQAYLTANQNIDSKIERLRILLNSKEKEE
jgi:hypothetical protein